MSLMIYLFDVLHVSWPLLLLKARLKASDLESLFR
jgi:hypothetical protein